ncbi:MAG: hypothetical protein PHD67_07335 [Oscillospiraceae bacterium]|nr:hypothetical protein [Oscillospiraceae bacterium]
MKRVLCVLLCMLMLFSLAACGKPSEKEISEKLYEIDCWLTTDVWGDGFNQVLLYISGQNSEAEIDEILAGLEETLEKQEEYGGYIAALEDERYDNLKERWDYVSGEIDKLHAALQAEKPHADGGYALDTMLYEYYSDTFWDELAALDIYRYIQ